MGAIKPRKSENVKKEFIGDESGKIKRTLCPEKFEGQKVLLMDSSYGFNFFAHNDKNNCTVKKKYMMVFFRQKSRHSKLCYGASVINCGL